jgi:hypothetical protein
MSAPRWATALLRRLAASNDAGADVLVGDLEEAPASTFRSISASSIR